jgi:hypothetical protein
VADTGTDSLFEEGKYTAGCCGRSLGRGLVYVLQLARALPHKFLLLGSVRATEYIQIWKTGAAQTRRWISSSMEASSPSVAAADVLRAGNIHTRF